MPKFYNDSFEKRVLISVALYNKLPVEVGIVCIELLGAASDPDGFEGGEICVAFGVFCIESIKKITMHTFDSDSI